METAVVKPPETVDLVDRAATDPADFGSLYDRYFSRVYNYIRYRVRHADLADDLTARTFERALAHFGRFDPGRADPAVWLFTIARNVVNDHLRALRRRRWVSLAWVSDRESDTPRADELLLGTERRHRLLEAIGRLSARERDLLSLKFAVGQTNRQIAALTGLGAGNVGVIVHRAVRKLRKELGHEEQSDASQR